MLQSRPDNQSSNVSFERERGVYAIDVTRDVAHVVAAVSDGPERTGSISRLLHELSDAEVPIFLIKLHRKAVTFALAGEHVDRTEHALRQADIRATMRRDLAIVAIRASSMRDLSGVMSQIADALFEAGARLYETGDSHNSVQCLIEDGRVSAAIDRLCDTFHLDSAAVRDYRIEAAA